MISLIRKNHKKYSQIADYTKRGKLRAQLQLNKGDSIDNFQLIQKLQFKDFAIKYHHFLNKQNQTQEYHHFDCSQQINTLAFAFKLPAFQKSGLNYAVEKMIQCGSKKYPVRNLTYQMISRSFNPINSIITNNDYMMFSFQSHCIKDFKNLYDVYFSMIFNPLLKQQDFIETIRRLAFINNNPKQKLILDGQLIKQMKNLGNYLENTIYKVIYRQLLGKESLTICEPEQLIKVSFKDIVKFHKQVFIPSNCTLITHGDMSPSLTINLFNQLSKQNKLKNNQIINFSIKNLIQKPNESTKTIKIEHLQSEIPLILSFRIDQNQVTNEEKVLLSILSYILFDMPDSPFMKYNTQTTPYPPLYGFNQTHFNIGISMILQQKSQQKQIQDNQFLEKEKQIRQMLSQLCQNNINNDLIQRCLLHLQGSSFSSSGSKIIQSSIFNILKNKDINSIFNVSQLVTKTLKTFRKKNIFQNLIKKYILENNQFIRIYGKRNSDLSDNQQRKTNQVLYKIRQSLKDIQIKQIISFKGQVSLQNPSILPSININEIQIFQSPQPKIYTIKGIPIHHVQNQINNHIKLLFRFDFTDIDEQDLNLIQVFCKAFPRMGAKSMKSELYQQIVDKFIDKLQMNFQTQKVDQDNMKLYLYLKVQFTQRNAEHGFTVINGLFNQFKYNNYSALSKQIHRCSSQKYTDISQNIIEYHGLHLAGSKSPYCQIQDPIFHSRSVCSLAQDILKVANPKQYLIAISNKFNSFYSKIKSKERIQILLDCSQGNKSQFQRYLNLIFSSFEFSNKKIETISTLDFPQQAWTKYFPNYDQQICFQVFSVPFQSNSAPAIMVLSKMIHNNINKFNKIGGSFIHKGSLINFIGGKRNKVIELQEYYKKFEDIEQAKRNIFQHFSKTFYQDSFRSGVSMQKAKQFKQAVIATQKSQIESVLHQYLLKIIQNGQSSILVLGENLTNYEPLLKKGWEVQRSIQGASLKMESLSKKQIQFKGQRFLRLADC